MADSRQAQIRYLAKLFAEASDCAIGRRKNPDASVILTRDNMDLIVAALQSYADEQKIP
jgi:hypothetical protein